jgi:hypothetical protein
VRIYVPPSYRALVVVVAARDARIDETSRTLYRRAAAVDKCIKIRSVSGIISSVNTVASVGGPAMDLELARITTPCYAPALFQGTVFGR